MSRFVMLNVCEASENRYFVTLRMTINENNT